jgi:hypothetical protein
MTSEHDKAHIEDCEAKLAAVLYFIARVNDDIELLPSLLIFADALAEGLSVPEAAIRVASRGEKKS